MATNNEGAKAARAAYTNTHEFANQKVDPSCTKCAETPPIRAIILYPNIGTPLIVPPGEKYLNIFIAAEKSSKEHFGVQKNGSNTFPGPAIAGYRYVDKHLRFYSISNKKVKENTDEGRLWNDGKLCGKAFDNVKVWFVGRMNSGIIKDIDGNIVANIRKRTREQYSSIQPAHPDPDDLNASNVGLAWIYQIQIKLESIPNLPIGGAIASMAWMVAMPAKYKEQSGLAGMNDWEYQDKLIYDFLEAQKNNPKKSHFPDLYEFALTSATVSSTLPAQKKNVSHRLKAWHPFTIGTKNKLVIGHLSDVHINCRQFAMAKSKAQVLPGISPELGSKVDITFVSLKNLFDEMKKEGADALFITGDLLDFNRNIDPNEVGTEVNDQWKKFDVAKNINNPSLYKRGLDDMLMYSLLRYSYETLKLPVYLTTGNHEAYDIPYGISPRLNKKANVTGALEMSGQIAPPGKEDVSPEDQSSDSTSPFASIISVAKKVENKITTPLRNWQKGMNANQYTHAKANEGVAADHNLTIYEACLMYGPTYAQALTGENFTADNYDWFFTLFTPLADYFIEYNTQQIIGLDWGPAENYINVGGLFDITQTDLQGTGILPRASESVNAEQVALMESAFSKRKTNTNTLLFSHFTFINFHTEVPFKIGNKQNIVSHPVQQLNKYNVGTCEINQKWLYDKCINNQVQYHFSGHSHRSGVYKVVDGGSHPKVDIPPYMAATGVPMQTVTLADIKSVSGFDPGMEPSHPDNKNGDKTKLIVSSCGGPIGVQNLNNELFTFNMQLPSGTLLNIDAVPPIKTVKATATKVPFARPRLCVALDYLWIIWEMSDERKAEEPIRFANPDELAVKWPTFKIPEFFAVKFGEKVTDLNCVKEINIYVYAEKNSFRGLIKIDMRLDNKVSPLLKSKGYSHTLSFVDPSNIALINSLLKSVTKTTKPTLFCEIALSQPEGMAVQQFDVKDKWYFPIIIEKTPGGHWNLARQRKIRGEIPDWKWLGSAYPEKYTEYRPKAGG